MKTQIAMFTFTLGLDQSIGPAQLRALWTQACQSREVSVGRSHGSGPNGKPTYSLYAPQHLVDLPQVERRLRTLFEQHKLRAMLASVHSR